MMTTMSTWKTDLGQDELLHWFVPHPTHEGPRADGTEASSYHSLLQKPKLQYIYLHLQRTHQAAPQ